MKHFNPLLLAALLAAALFTGCIFGTDDDTSAGTRRLFVVTSDFRTGALISYSLDSLKRGPDSIRVNQDSRLVFSGKSLYVLERSGANNLLKYDPVAKQVVYQKHIYGNSNPSDLAVLNESVGFLTLEDSAKIFKVDLLTGDTLKSLNISAYTFVPPAGSGSSAGTPHAVRAVLSGDVLYVALQRRAPYPLPGGNSAVLRIKASTFTIIDTLTAPGKNASNLWVDGDNLYLACSGTLDTTDGALYHWALSTHTVSTVITEATLGGDIDGISCGEHGACVAQVSVAFGNEPVRKFDLISGTMGDLLPGVVDAFGGAVVDANTGNIYVGDRKATASGVRLYNAAGVKLLGPISTGLPPYSLAIGEF